MEIKIKIFENPSIMMYPIDEKYLQPVGILGEKDNPEFPDSHAHYVFTHKGEIIEVQIPLSMVDGEVLQACIDHHDELLDESLKRFNYPPE